MGHHQIGFGKFALAAAASITLTLSTLGSIANAASLTGTVSCPDGSSNTIPFGAECQFSFGTRSASARSGAQFGSFSTEAIASTTSGGVASSATAAFTDEIFFGVVTGIYRLKFESSGRVDLDVSGFSGGTNGTIGFARADWSIGKVNGPRLTDRTIATATSVNGEIFTSTSAPTEPNFIDLLFTNGRLDIFGGLTATANCSLGGCTASSLFGSTLTILPGELFSTSGERLTGVSATSASGFDYLSVTTVPLPPTLALLLAALSGLGLVAHRRQKFRTA